jgi:hypothetical protein
MGQADTGWENSALRAEAIHWEDRRNEKKPSLLVGTEDAADGRGPKELNFMVFQPEQKPERIWPEVSSASQVTSLFQPDTNLAFQYFDVFRRNSCPEGEKKIMLAVLEDAVASFQKYYFASGKKGKEHFREAEEWIIEEKDDRLFSFTSICELLEISPDYLRRGLLQWREKQTSLLRLSKGKEVKRYG